MAAFNLVTWNSTKNANVRQPSNTATFDFQSIKVGADALEISQLGSGAGASFNFNNKRLSTISDGTQNTDAVSLGQMNSAISFAVLTGGTVKESVLVPEQLSSTGGIRSALAIFAGGVNFADTDTVVLKNSSTTETFTFTSGAPGAFTPAVGANANASLQNLVARIVADSTIWSAKTVTTALNSINSVVTVVYEKTTSSSTPTSRIYVGAGNTGTLQIVDNSGQTEYKTSTAAVSAPTADGAASFGFCRPVASLVNGEIHYVHETDVMESYDQDGLVWTTFQNGAVPDGTSASGGAIKGKLTLDSDFGLQATAGVARIVTNGQAIGFSAGALALILTGTTLSQSVSGLKVAAAGITQTELAASAFTGALSGGAGTAVDVVASGIDANRLSASAFTGALSGGGGTAVNVVSQGITEQHLHASVAGNGLTGGNNVPLAVGAGDGITVAANAVSVDFTTSLTNGEASALTVGQVVYQSSGGSVLLADATSAQSKLTIGVVSDASIASAASGKVFVKDGAILTGYTGLTPGEVFVSKAVPGGVTQDTSAFVTGDNVYCIGHAINATTILFAPYHKIEL